MRFRERPVKSRSLDAGADPNLTQLFSSLYGISITRDVDHIQRPQGAAWDMGAHEFSPAIFEDGFENGDLGAWS